MEYSTPEQIEAFVARLAATATPTRKPLFVLDLDGNAVLGYNPTPAAPAYDDPRRNFAPDADMEALVRDGQAEPALFARKPLDARLAKPLVVQLNRLAAAGELFGLAVLTSRSEADALALLRDSGVQAPEATTLIADSGAVMRVGGERSLLRAPSAPEQEVLGGADRLPAQLEPKVDALLAQHGHNPHGRPPLEVEQKGIAANLHFRAMLGHYGLGDDAPEAQALAELLQEELAEYLAQSPAGSAFKLLHGPATLEMKLADIHKGNGLNALVDAALDAGTRPSAIVFAGDDLCNHAKDGTVSPGTDYFAFAALPPIAARTGIPAYGIHTQHNTHAGLEGGMPNPAKAIAPMPAPYDAPASAALTLPAPPALAALVDAALTRAAERSAGYHSSRAQAPQGAALRFR